MINNLVRNTTIVLENIEVSCAGYLSDFLSNGLFVVIC